MLMRHFWQSTVFGIFPSFPYRVANSDLTLYSNYHTTPRSLRIPLPFAKLRQASRSSEMEGVDGT